MIDLHMHTVYSDGDKTVEEILKQCMENAIKLSVPLEVEVSCAHNWYDLK